MEDDTLLINEVKVSLRPTDPVEECVSTKFVCCKDGELSMINEIKIDQGAEGNNSENIKDWTAMLALKNSISTT